MKIRTGFVSNSSSSSFLVISENPKTRISISWPQKTIHIDDKFGTTEFGWEDRRYYDFGSKLIFCYLQALYVDNQKWIKMIEKVLTDGKNSDMTEIQWDITIDRVKYKNREENSNLCYGYIDHQSNSTEGSNIEVFRSEEKLRDFLFNEQSHIQGGNDNDYF
jgi:hypothetical protein